uniref:U74-Liphistoxin-Lsp1c_1 n=1 Tax=Liphistius sp. SGP-2016 TaxID=1905180 RepID=A0A4Q8K1M4_9ARAC
MKVWVISGALWFLGSLHAFHHFERDEHDDYVIYAASNYATVGESQCFGTLGCFEWTRDFFDPQHRPTNKKIQSREKVGTFFHLYTRKNRNTPQILNADDVNTIKSSNFINTAPTAFVTHGLKGSCDKSDFMKKTKNELLNLAEYNVILVDWRDGCDSIVHYDQAVSNTRLIGAEIAHLISKLKKVHSYSSKNVYLIGHSLGAQASGFAGKRLQSNYNLKLGRITALDPAGPKFTKMPTTVKVYKTDANFVDVIHTDTNGTLISLGLPEPVGHMDFYPEGGNTQPGCIALAGESDHTETYRILDGGVSCSHSRAHQLFVNSINAKGAVPVAYRCKNWKTFKKGECGSCGADGSDCAMIGYRARDSYKATSKNNSFYITTGASEPFWIYLYQVTVEISKYSARQSGKLKVILKERDQRAVHINIPTSNLNPGEKYHALVTTQFAGFQIREIDFSWRGLFTYADPFTSPDVRVLRSDVDVTRLSVRRRLITLESTEAGFAAKKLKVEKISVIPMTVIKLKSQYRGVKNYCNPNSIPKRTTVTFTSCN